MSRIPRFPRVVDLSADRSVDPSHIPVNLRKTPRLCAVCVAHGVAGIRQNPRFPQCSFVHSPHGRITMHLPRALVEGSVRCNREGEERGRGVALNVHPAHVWGEAKQTARRDNSEKR